MSVKDTKAEVNTITYDRDKIEEKVGSIYEAIVIMGKRAEQINAEIRTELHQKLDEFAVHNSTLEEVFENREQIEISKKERLESAIAFTRQVEREYPNSDLSKEALDIRAKLEKEVVEFAKLQKEVEARKAEFTEKQKAAEAKEDAKKQVKDQQEANKIKIDSAKISTPEPGATFKIRRN